VRGYDLEKTASLPRPSPPLGKRETSQYAETSVIMKQVKEFFVA
jgi:hypothetical protein